MPINTNQIHSRLTLRNTAYEDLRTPVNTVRVPGVKAPTWTAYSAGQILYFADQAVEGNEEEVYFTIQLTHSYKQGSNIAIHVHWTPDGDETATVRWGLEYEWLNIGDTASSTTTIHVDAATTNEQDKHKVADFGTVTGTGKTISSMLVCRLFRNSSHANDDYTGSAGLLEVDAHYQIDTFGSNIEWWKYTSTSSSTSTSTSTSTSSSSTTTAP